MTCAKVMLDFAARVAGVHVICQPLQALVGLTVPSSGTRDFVRTSTVLIMWGDEKSGDIVDVDLKDKLVVILSSPEELDKVFIWREDGV